MAFASYPAKGGIPSGNTASRPSSPAIGDTYYNGELGILEIYTASGWQVCSAPPGISTLGTATAVAGSTRTYVDLGAVSVPFTPAATGGLPTNYVATSSPGGITASGSSSPIVVTGLTAGTAYTFTITGSNGYGTSAATSASNSVTPTTLPQTPTIGTATVVGTAGNVEVTFTAGATGGSAITNYKYSTDGTTYTAFGTPQTTSPLTISGLTLGTAVTLRIKAVNANGDSPASAASNSVTPLAAKATGGTVYVSGGYVYHKFTSTGTFVPSSTITGAEVLRIAGAGGTSGGTGGAGGALSTGSLTLANATTYTATVGAGGAGLSDATQGAPSGTNSNLTGGSLSLTAAVGGGGTGGGWTGSGNGANAKSGGSGGGGEPRYGVGGATALDPGGAGTAGQGNSGGNGGLTSNSSLLRYCSGGGGGAGSAGGNANGTSTSGDGGNGTSAFSAWGLATSSGVNVSGTYYYAAAAGGGANDAAPAANGTGWAYTANTGNSGKYPSGYTGNSGIVIVRYV